MAKTNLTERAGSCRRRGHASTVRIDLQAAVRSGAARRAGRRAVLTDSVPGCSLTVAPEPTCDGLKNTHHAPVRGPGKMPRTKQNHPKNLKDKIEEAQKQLTEPKASQKAADNTKGLKRKKIVGESQKLPKSQ
ncbi:hypothetical protein OJAV_G00109580 [Oryzias javanicus]|uniref:Uncharacterized protein n=1 Tax=Oryzias javanicus TaxID=123683 RepID=A0A437CVS7_ORYJA|nr:hypothetical protein OJAV_G00109580 [Oryzias javanicus]